MRSFIFEATPTRVAFGAGQLRTVRSEVERLGARRAVVLTTPRQRERGELVAQLLGELCAGVYPVAAMHTPIDVTGAALERLRADNADCVVSVGGGSTIGLGKALAARTGVDQVCIPTTYAGSELTPILGETRDGTKTTRRDASILPETVIYDVELTLSLPISVSAASGMNAIAHAVEALYAEQRNPLISAVAEEGIRAMGRSLPRIAAAPGDLTARSDALGGAWLCGLCLGAVGMALHHKLCHTLGGLFDLPHAETHSIVLPHVVAYNAAAAPEAMAGVARALDVPDPAHGLDHLARRIGLPRSLRDIGMPENGIGKAAELAMRDAYWNPRPLEPKAIHDLIAAAWRGDPPRR